MLNIDSKLGEKMVKKNCVVENHGEVSNFLVEDYDAVLSFMNAETQKRKLKL
jgi:cytidylate kinase